jgi:hypothetical protein
MRCFTRFLAIVALPVAVAAQNSHSPTIGLYGGASRTSLHGPDVPGPLHTNGFLGGIYGQWSAGPHVAFQPELQFAQKGNREVDRYRDGTFAMRIRLNYAEVPLLVRVSATTVAGRFTPFLIAGPEVAFKTGCDLTVKGLAGSYTCDDLPAAESLDYGVIAGGGVDVGVAGRRLTLSARYDHGFVDVFKGNDPKNRAVSVLLGVPLLTK